LVGLGVRLRFVWTSYWGRLGIGQIGLPEWGYTLIGIVGLFSLLGLFKQFWRLRRSSNARPATPVDRRSLFVLIAAVLSSLAVLIYFALVNPTGANGRYLFPVSAAIAGLLAYGLRGWYRPAEAKIDRLFGWGVCAAMLLFSVSVLWFIMVPAYAAPDQLALSAVRASTQPIDVHFDDSAILLGAALQQKRAAPGDEVAVKLCWQTLAPTRTPLAFFVHLLGERNAILGERTSLHGLSRYPSVNWEPNRIFCDNVPVRVDDTAPTGLYDVEVGVFDLTSKQRLEPVTTAGDVVAPLLIDRVKVMSAVSSILPVAGPQPIDFGGQIKLLARTVEPLYVSAGQSVTATLTWQAERVPDKDYTVFVQLWNSLGQQVANADSMPQAGRYPTSFWDANEIVSDTHRIDLPVDLPAGEYRIIIGWYDLQSGARLPRVGDPEDAVQIANIEVTAP
ncbi:MAG TPA: hypothetical protein VMP08_06425, partial [Anaerolineae bacterium]|nr:hypothetical protein [Anaerolineae bacterium]